MKLKKLLACFSAMALALTSMSVGALADDVVAKIGDTEYATLQAAFDAATEVSDASATNLVDVQLLTDVELSANVVSNGYIKLDLNGHSISGDTTLSASIYELVTVKKSTLYITNSDIDKAGSINGGTKDAICVSANSSAQISSNVSISGHDGVYNYGSLTIDDGAYINATKNGIYSYKYSTVNFNGGKIEMPETKSTYGINANYGANVNINGGEVIVKGASSAGLLLSYGVKAKVLAGTIKSTSSNTTYGIWIQGTKTTYADYGVTNVEFGGTANITSTYYGIYDAYAGELNITGGTIDVNGIGITGNGTKGYGDTKINISDGIISGNSGIYHPQTGTLTISGGKITGISRGIEIESGTLTINDGEIEATTAKSDFVNPKTGDGTTVFGAALAMVCRSSDPVGESYQGGMVVNILGGTFTAMNPVGKYHYGSSSEATSMTSLNIFGGKFYANEGGVTIAIDEDCGTYKPLTGGVYSEDDFEEYIADGYKKIDNTDPATMVDYPYTIGEVTSAVSTVDEFNTAAAASSSVEVKAATTINAGTVDSSVIGKTVVLNDGSKLVMSNALLKKNDDSSYSIVKNATVAGDYIMQKTDGNYDSLKIVTKIDGLADNDGNKSFNVTIGDVTRPVKITDLPHIENLTVLLGLCITNIPDSLTVTVTEK